MWPHQHRFLLIYVQNVIWRINKIFKKLHVGLKIKYDLLKICPTKHSQVGTSSIRSFLQLPIWFHLGCNLCKHAGGHSVTIEACTSFTGVCVVWRSWSSMEPFAQWGIYMKSVITYIRRRIQEANISHDFWIEVTKMSYGVTMDHPLICWSSSNLANESIMSNKEEFICYFNTFK